VKFRQAGNFFDRNVATSNVFEYLPDDDTVPLTNDHFVFAPQRFSKLPRKNHTGTDTFSYPLYHSENSIRTSYWLSLKRRRRRVADPGMPKFGADPHNAFIEYRATATFK